MPKIVVVGGFLGAGKTSLILQAAVRLRSRGLNVAIVTNDQSAHLVDTFLAADLGFTVGEVAGGCFCCRFDDLIREFEDIEMRGSVDVVFAEPVGSCTDIVATVIRPLNQLCKDRFIPAPFSVVVDPQRDIGEMNEMIGYLYRQQLAEADLVVVSKTDITPDGVDIIRNRFSGVIPEQAVFGLSAVTGNGIDSWLQSVLGEQIRQPLNLPLDYKKYTDAEAALGWLNLSADWHANREIRLMTIGEPLLHQMQKAIHDASLKAAHVKITLSSQNALRIKGSFTSNHSPVLWNAGDTNIHSSSGSLVLNARAEGSAENLSDVVKQTLVSVERLVGLDITVKHLDCFSPRAPKPTHRLNNDGVPVPLDKLE
jgi:G3E family GTPase